MSRYSRVRLQDILNAIDWVSSYVEGMTYAVFLSGRKTHDAITRNIEIIGETARALPGELKEKHPDIPWEEIVGMLSRIG